MKTIVISRKKWGRGEPTSGLLRSQKTGRQCCLGFVCRAFGIAARAITNRVMPYDLDPRFQAKLPKWLRSSADLLKAAEVNDSASMSELSREEYITEIFARHRLKTKFVD